MRPPLHPRNALDSAPVSCSELVLGLVVGPSRLKSLPPRFPPPSSHPAGRRSAPALRYAESAVGVQTLPCLGQKAAVTSPKLAARARNHCQAQTVNCRQASKIRRSVRVRHDRAFGLWRPARKPEDPGWFPGSDAFSARLQWQPGPQASGRPCAGYLWVGLLAARHAGKAGKAGKATMGVWRWTISGWGRVRMLRAVCGACGLAQQGWRSTRASLAPCAPASARPRSQAQRSEIPETDTWAYGHSGRATRTARG